MGFSRNTVIHVKPDDMEKLSKKLRQILQKYPELKEAIAKKEIQFCIRYNKKTGTFTVYFRRRPVTWTQLAMAIIYKYCKGKKLEEVQEIVKKVFQYLKRQKHKKPKVDVKISPKVIEYLKKKKLEEVRKLWIFTEKFP